MLPIGSLVGMSLVRLRQFDQSLLATDGVERHLGLERRRVVAPWSSAHALVSFQDSLDKLNRPLGYGEQK